MSLHCLNLQSDKQKKDKSVCSTEEGEAKSEMRECAVCVCQGEGEEGEGSETLKVTRETILSITQMLHSSSRRHPVHVR